MEKITSFTVDHLHLLPGVYVSRKDKVGDQTVTTFDIRMTRPNYEPVMNTAEIHTIEHLGATFLRNHKDFKDKVLYFGPMGCRTGFYLLLVGDLQSQDIIGLLKAVSYTHLMAGTRLQGFSVMHQRFNGIGCFCACKFFFIRFSSADYWHCQNFLTEIGIDV